MPQRIITFTTDFGTQDHFVAVMKGVILGIAPQAYIVDVTHAIAPYSITDGAFVISETWPYYPKGTIHVVVVDPGVGSARRPVLVEAGGHIFIGPDNGVFSLVYSAGPHKVRAITNTKLMRKEISRTFHGRDIFAPVAGHLAKGTKAARVGAVVRDPYHLQFDRPMHIARRRWRGVVLRADRFGNLITNFPVHEFTAVKTSPFEAQIGGEHIRRLALTYAETEVGELFLIVGSSGYLEIAANQASAAALLGCGAGANIELEIG